MSKAKKVGLGAIVALVATLTLTNVAVLAGGASFVDVGPSHPFFYEIEWMNEAGISEGYPDDTYRPGHPVTRQAMSAFMQRLNASYRVVTDSRDPANGNVISMSAQCDPGERALAGGHAVTGSTTHFVYREQPNTSGSIEEWLVYWRTVDGGNANPTNVEVWVLCGPPLEANVM
jgi:hypothetical protein